MRLYYRDGNVDLLVCDVIANHTVSIDDMLRICGINMNNWASNNDIEDWQPEYLVLEG
jgi:hypothetical protein